MKEKRIVAAVTGDGRIVPLEQEIPELEPGAVLVEVFASLVSPGTELGGWHSLRAAREKTSDAAPRPFGYSNAGRVLKVGADVTRFKPGDRVACIGAGYAQHTNYAVVPHHLCIALPDNVTYAQGSYAMLAATGLQALRRAAPEFGEWTLVAGLGLVGQLTARLFQLAGNYVIGWDSIPMRTSLAKRCNADDAIQIGQGDICEQTRSFTGGEGLDTAVVAFGGNADAAMKDIETCMKKSPDGHPMGNVIVVGGARFTYTSSMTNIDIRRASRTGPGYHDKNWENGVDYPPVFMRWTTRSNLALCMRLIAEGRLNVDALTTHCIPLQDVEAGVNAMLDDPDSILGVIFVNQEAGK